MPYYKDQTNAVHHIDSEDEEYLLPDGASPISDAEAATLIAEAQNNMRPPVQVVARVMLDESDITVIRCAEAGVQVPAAWRDYRAALRAIVSAQSVSESTQLPPRPDYPPNT